MSLSQLRGNFQEIYTAVHDDKVKEPQLVANWWESRVYHTPSGWGRVWTVIYHIYSYFSNKDICAEKLKQAIRKTHETFHQQLKIAEEYGTTYQSHVKHAGESRVIDEDKLAAARSGIIDWNESTHRFLKLVDKKNEKIEALFKKSLPSTPLFSARAACHKLYQQQQMIHLEGLCSHPLPISILSKLSLGTALDDEEETQLKRWLKQLNQTKGLISIRQLHRAFSAFVHRLPSEADLMRLELELVDRESQLFLQRDQKHLQWRDALKKGDIVMCNEKEYMLGEQFGKKEDGEDHNIVFALAKDPEKVLVIGVNEAILGLRRRLGEDHGIGVRLATYHEIDATGRCALVERLHDPVEKHPWTSIERITPEDHAVAFTICNLVRWFLEQKRTSHNLSAKHLMFNRDGELKCLKVPLEGDFDFGVLEKFIFDAANGNLPIYRNLMNDSGFCKYPVKAEEVAGLSLDEAQAFYEDHSWWGFYREVFRKTIQGEEDAIEHLKVQRDLTHVVVDRAHHLAEEALRIKKECCRKGLAEQTVIERMIALHEKNLSGSILWPTLADDVVAFSLDSTAS